jgi:hypothetical protein
LMRCATYDSTLKKNDIGTNNPGGLFPTTCPQ